MDAVAPRSYGDGADLLVHNSHESAADVSLFRPRRRGCTAAPILFASSRGPREDAKAARGTYFCASANFASSVDYPTLACISWNRAKPLGANQHVRALCGMALLRSHHAHTRPTNSRCAAEKLRVICILATPLFAVCFAPMPFSAAAQDDLSSLLAQLWKSFLLLGAPRVRVVFVYA
jgi:hypothetical protein